MQIFDIIEKQAYLKNDVSMVIFGFYRVLKSGGKIMQGNKKTCKSKSSHDCLIHMFLNGFLDILYYIHVFRFNTAMVNLPNFCQNCCMVYKVRKREL